MRLGTVVLLMMFCVSAVKSGEAFFAPDYLKSQISDMTTDTDNLGRGKAIRAPLKAMGVAFKDEAFTRKSYSGKELKGTNIVADLGGNGQRHLVLGGHYDRTEVGDGVVDNAASCVMLLGLAQQLKNKPLTNWKVSIVFFDFEEAGLVGSMAYVEKHEEKLPDMYINMDVFGYGETLYVMSKSEQQPAAAALKKAAEDMSFPIRIVKTYPPSDHLSFLKAKVPAISISLINNAEIDPLTSLIQGKKLEEMPPIIEIIHTPNDQMKILDTKAMSKAAPVISKFVRLLDAK